MLPHTPQELLAQEDPLLVHRYINELQNVSVGLRDAYYTMRMGIDADRVAGKRARGGLLLGRAPGCVDAVAPTR